MVLFHTTMKSLVLVLSLLQYGLTLCNDILSKNATSNSNKTDMYVINAMVYQVGIITNKSDDKQLNSSMSNQEALTIFRTNGSKIDLSSIPAPLLTNVTAQSLVQVTPKQNISGPGIGQPLVGWNDLKHFASLQEGMPSIKSTYAKLSRKRRSEDNSNSRPMMSYFANGFRNLFKRDAPLNKTIVKVVKGTAVVPQAVGVQSIAIPPLLTLNNNLSVIPVPIPNTSVVHYTKVNTVFRNP